MEVHTTLQGIRGIRALPKRAIRIINHAGYDKHTKVLFVKLKNTEICGSVQFKTVQFMFKVKKKKSLSNILLKNI